MQQLIYTLISFFSLNVLHKSKHSGFLKILCEKFTNKGIHMKTTESNELPAVTHWS